jgi:Secretion system C-terminal sorting domain
MWSSQFGSGNYLYDAVELPSGSIIACGSNRTFEGGAKDWGWVIKVSKNGCVDTLFCAPLAVKEPENVENWLKIQPNPAHDFVDFFFNLPEKSAEISIQIFNMDGVLVLKTAQLSNSFHWETGDNPAGVYFYRVFTGEKDAQSGKIILIK